MSALILGVVVNIIASCARVCCAHEQSSADLLWRVFDGNAAFSSSAVTIIGPPAFAVASSSITFLNAIGPAWNFTAGLRNYLVCMPSHPAVDSPGAVDTFGAAVFSENATLWGLSTTGMKEPAWTLDLAGCGTGGTTGGPYVDIDASDAGDFVAFLCFYSHQGAIGQTTRVVGAIGQTGESWTYDLGPAVASGPGQVQVRSVNQLWGTCCNFLIIVDPRFLATVDGFFL